MDIATVIISIGILIFLAHFFGWLFSFVRIPDVLMLMIIGILLGPLLGIISPDFLGEAGNVLIMLILVMILFEGAIKLKLSSLRKAAFGTITLGISSFFFTMIGVGLLLSQFTGLFLIPSFLIGAIVGSNSTALVIPLIEKLNIKEESRTTLFLESGLSDIFSIVFALALITSMEVGVFQVEVVFGDIVLNLLMATLLGIFFAFAWSLLLNKIHNIQNSIFATPAFVFIVFGITESLGYGGLISVIAFGVVLGNIPALTSSLKENYNFLYNIFRPKPLSQREISFFAEMVFIIKIFFFLFIGISLNLEEGSLLLLGLLLTLFIFVTRYLAVIFSVPRSVPKFDASIMSVTAPRGLAPAILALIPIQRGLEGGEIIQDITYAVIFFSILLTSFLIFLLYNTGIRKIYESFLSGFTKNPQEGTKEYPEEGEKEKKTPLT